MLRTALCRATQSVRPSLLAPRAACFATTSVGSASGGLWDLAGPSSNSSNSTSTSTSSSSGNTDATDDVEAPPASNGPPFEAAMSNQPSGAGVGLHDWARSFHGLSAEPFSKEVSDVLLAPVDPRDVEIKPDGIIYLPEIKYRRILNKAFGPGGWGLAPRTETNIGAKQISREYALVCLGRLVSVARGEQDYFDPSGIATATEGCKSNALMRCCKDLGIASELWDPRFIREFKQKYAADVWGEHVVTKKKKKLWRRKDDKLAYPYEEKGFSK